jgi:hypothetical protein
MFLLSSFRGCSQLYREQNPTAFAGLQTRTPQAARRAGATDGANQSVLKTWKTDSGFDPAGRPGITM